MVGRIRENAADDLVENSEINVTPFIDVMLVLLIIFMVAAPLSTVDVAVDLPGSNAPPTERPSQPMYLTVEQDLSLHLGEKLVLREQLAAELESLSEGDHDKRVYLRADKTVDYGDLMEVMNLLRTAGYLKIALVGAEETPARLAADKTPAATGVSGE